MTNFKLEEIPPGRDRSQGVDAGQRPQQRAADQRPGRPRRVLHAAAAQAQVPNVSYGEDYAVGLAISRDYQIGRIYEPVYLCRRWEGNTDADLDIAKQNTFNTYKDSCGRSKFSARQQKNAGEREVVHARATFDLAARGPPSARADRSGPAAARQLRGHFAQCGIRRDASSVGGVPSLRLQFNPASDRLHRAKVDANRSASASAFCARRTSPPSSAAVPFGEDYVILCNPFPIFPRAFHDPASTSTCRSASPTRSARCSTSPARCPRIHGLLQRPALRRIGARPPALPGGRQGFMTIESEYDRLKGAPIVTRASSRSSPPSIGPFVGIESADRDARGPRSRPSIAT